MSTFDIILILIIAGFVFHGLFFGLIRTLGSIVGIIVGIWLANIFYLPLYELIKNLFLGHDTLGRAVVFVILFVIINRLIGFGFAILDGTYNILSIVPFLKTINRLSGALFGLIEGGLLLGVGLYALKQYPFLYSFLEKYIAKSQVAPYLINYAAMIIPFLPNLWEKINEWLNKGKDMNLGNFSTETAQLKVKGWMEGDGYVEKIKNFGVGLFK